MLTTVNQMEGEAMPKLIKLLKCKNILLYFVLILFIGGCDRKSIRCNDIEAKNQVKEIATQQLSKKIGINKAKLIEYDVEYVRTTQFNNKTTLSMCDAYLYVNKNKKQIDVLSNIKYTVQMTDDGSNFVVEVFGLNDLNPCKYGFKDFCKSKTYEEEYNDYL